jgi:hypothetical protein
MSSDDPDFASFYAGLPEERLLELAASPDTLTAAARAALQAELAHR